MIRNFVAGLIWGGVVSVAGLAVISQVAPPPGARQSGTPETEALADAAPVQTQPDQTQPVKAPPAADAVAPAPSAAPAPAGGDGAAAPADAPAAPALPSSPPAPDMGAGDAAQPRVLPPAPASGAGADAPETGAAPGDLAAGGAAGAKPGAELPPPGAAAAPDPLLAPGAEPAPPLPPALVTPQPDAVPDAAPEGAAAPAKAGDAPALPRVLVPGESPGLAPAPSLPRSADGVDMGRLPQIGAAPAPAPAEAAGAAPAAEEPPLRRFAAPFENPTGKPLFALVLVDDGTPALDRARLAALPFPVSFVIDPLAANAAEAAATYRAGGKEVVMLASGLPAGATPADVEQSFQAMATGLPEAVAAVDLPAAGFQDDRALSAQVVEVLAAQGRGLVTYDRGLNAADQVARRAHLAAATLYRELDASGEDLSVIRRYLDRAAFYAAQEGRVAVIGKARPETVAAIMEWTIEGRASTVTLAPVTAVLVAK